MLYNDILVYLGYFLLILNFCLYTGSFSYKSKASLYFWFYLLFTLVVQIYSEFLASRGFDNLFLSHYYFIIQFICLSLFYREILPSIFTKPIKATLIVILVILTAQYLIDYSLYRVFNLMEVVITSLPIIIYSFVFFSYNINNKTRFIYINIGVFVYLLCSTLLFTSGNLMVKLDPLINQIVWMVNAGLYILFQVLIFIEWRKNYYKKTLRS